MSPILERLRKGEVLLADGAMGTQLLERGLQPGACPEVWNLEHPEVLEAVATAYLEAGADILQTNTFGGSPLKLADYGLETRCEEINRVAVTAVRRAAGEHAFVSGSCGPSGRILKPFGDTAPEEVYLSFKRQIEALSEAGVDLICVETMIDLKEAIQALKAARDVSKDIPVLASMTFEKTKKGYFTIMGNGIEEAAAGLEAAGAGVIGANCGNGIEVMIDIARTFRAATRLPLLIQSNAGLPELRNGRLHYPEDPPFFAEKTKELVEIGVGLVGGCCGTTPDHIGAMRTVIDSLK